MNRRAWQYWALVLLSACILLPGCRRHGEDGAKAPPPNKLQHIVQRGKLVAGWAPYAPYASANIKEPGGRPEGYYIDLFERVASEAGLKVTWVETTWTTMISDLKADKFDVMAAPVFRTIPRSMEVAFTGSIDYFGLSAVVRAGDDRFKSLDDFNQTNVKISVVQGEVGEEFASRRLARAQINRHKSGNIAVALVDVIQGQADVGICDAWTARQFVAEHAKEAKDLFPTSPFNKVGAGWFVRPSDVEFLQFLNTSIDWLKTSGALDEVAKGYELPSFR